jgi:hypothetical protein
MAVEKTALDHSVSMVDARLSLEQAIVELQETFRQCPKAILKRRLKKFAQIPTWSDPSLPQ